MSSPVSAVVSLKPGNRSLSPIANLEVLVCGHTKRNPKIQDDRRWFSEAYALST
jgi:hypothetical protein